MTYYSRSKEVFKNDKTYGILEDLGLGKETKFEYPWHPGGSPSICYDAKEGLGKYKDKDAFN